MELFTFYQDTVTLILKPHKDTTKPNYRPISLIIIGTNILTQILANQIQHDQIGIIQEMQGLLTIPKLLNIIHHKKKLKDKYHIIISLDAEKVFDKNQHHFMLKKTRRY